MQDRIKLILILSFLVFPSISKAEIGLSPSRFEFDMLKDTVLEKSIKINRTKDELKGDLLFDLESSEEFVNFNGLKKLFLPAGQPDADLSFIVDARNLSLGKHTSNLLLSKYLQKTGIEGNPVRFAIGTKVVVNIVDKLEEVDLSTSGHGKDFFYEINDIFAKKYYFIYAPAKFSVSIRNIGDKKIINTPIGVKIYKNNVKIIEDSLVRVESLSPGEIGKIDYQYAFSDGGTYQIEFLNGYSSKRVEFVVNNPWSYVVALYQELFKHKSY